jgi:hypothetical protein
MGWYTRSVYGRWNPGMPSSSHPVGYHLGELIGRHPGVGRHHELGDSLHPEVPTSLGLPSSTALNGCLVFHSGMLQRQRLHPVEREGEPT